MKIHSLFPSRLLALGMMLPFSRVSCTWAATRQPGSPIKSTRDLANPTSDTRPTRPSWVSTFRLGRIPSRLPRSI